MSEIKERANQIKIRPKKVEKNNISHSEVEKIYEFKADKDSLIPTFADYVGYVFILILLWLAYMIFMFLWNALSAGAHYVPEAKDKVLQVSKEVSVSTKKQKNLSKPNKEDLSRNGLDQIADFFDSLMDKMPKDEGPKNQFIKRF